MCEVLASSCYGSVRILSGSVGQVKIVGRRNTVIMLTIRGMIRVPVAFLPFPPPRIASIYVTAGVWHVRTYCCKQRVTRNT